MANNFRLKTKSNVGIATTLIYTVPASTSSTIIGLTLTNIYSGNIKVSVIIDRIGSDSVFVLRKVLVPIEQTLEVMNGNKIVMEATDNLKIVSDTASSLDASLSILEIS